MGRQAHLIPPEKRGEGGGGRRPPIEKNRGERGGSEGEGEREKKITISHTHPSSLLYFKKSVRRFGRERERERERRDGEIGAKMRPASFSELVSAKMIQILFRRTYVRR